jgi:hypothetical protein
MRIHQTRLLLIINKIIFNSVQINVCKKKIYFVLIINDPSKGNEYPVLNISWRINLSNFEVSPRISFFFIQ